MIWNTDLKEREIIDQLLKYAKVARLRGLLSLDSELRSIEDPYFRNAMQLAVDSVRTRTAAPAPPAAPPATPPTTPPPTR